MYAYYRTSSQSTVNQKILRGSIANTNTSDLVIVKGNSLEWMTIGQVAPSDPNLLTQQLQQSAFGIIYDTHILHCDFASANESMDEETDTEVYEETSYSRKIRNHSLIQGQDVLVALSEYGKLVFMTIHCDKSLKVKRFETLTEVYLDSPGFEYNKIGKKLAVDPYSRAIAVGSFQDKFDILILNQKLSRSKFDPINCRGSESEPGIIWHMEFLHTETASMDRILLALVIYNDVDRVCRIIVYAIDASDINNVIVEQVGRLPLERNTPLPLLLIPLKFQPEAFVLVTEQQVCLLTADDVHCGNVLYPTSFIPRQFGSTECPLFTSYASHIDQDEEYLYLGSAEGYLYKLYVFSTGEVVWDAIEQTNPISQSMCMLGSINMLDQEDENCVVSADIILYAGESADSQVLAIPLEKHAHQPVIKHIVLQSLVNRAPLIDYQVADNFRDHQDALITCSGQDKHGSLSIISHGVETSALHSSKPEWNGISRLWNLSASLTDSHEVPCLVASSAIDTRLLCAKDGHIKDITSSSGVEFDTETIFANTIPARDLKLILQIYPKGFSIIDIGKQGGTCILTQWKPEDNDEYRIELGTSWQEDGLTYVAICKVKSDTFVLHVLAISDRYKEDSSSMVSFAVKEIANIPLNNCPSYISQFTIKSDTILSIGTFEPSIMFFKVKEEIVEYSQTLDLSCLSPGQFTVPHSSAVVNSVSDEPFYFLVGLRQGSILSFKIDLDKGVISDKRPHLHNIGSRAVRLSPLYQSKNAVYALSEQLWRITCSERSELVMEHILLPKFSKFIDAFAPFDCDLPLLHTTGEPLAVVADGKLQIFQLSLQSQTNTFKINLGETPRKVIYDKSLNYIITITSSMDNNERKNSIRLVDPISGQPLSESQPLVTDTDYGRSDIVLSTAEWSVENNGKIYKYLCIGIGHPKEPFHSYRSGMSARVSETLMNRGTLLLFRLKMKPQRSSGFSLSRVWTQDKLPGGIFAIRPHPAGLLFSAGHHLYLYRLVSGRLVEVAHVPLRFTITSIHEVGDRICVTSHTDSISFYQFNAESNQLEFLKSDVVARSIHRSLMLSSRLAVGVSQSGGMVALYDDPEDTSFESRLKCLFSFHYPDIIVEPYLALLRSQYDIDRDIDTLTQHLISWTEQVGATHNSKRVDSAVVKPIVGCTVSGGIVHVYRISPALYVLLDVLQNILIEFEPTKPLLGSAQDFKKWYCELSGSEKDTIHGDLIESYLRLSADEQLRAIQNEDGTINTSLVSAIEAFSTTDSADLMEDIHDNPENYVDFIINLLSGFEKYR